MSGRLLTENIFRRCDLLAECTEEPGRITRRFCTPAMAEAHTLLREWMESAGLFVRMDAAGNIIGRMQGGSSRTLLIGSHLDTVPNGGKYDGPLGVLIGLAVVESLRGTDLPFSVDVIGFSEEEGVRFKEPFIGSHAVAGTFNASILEKTDAGGVSIADALRAFGCAPEGIPSCERSDAFAFVEPHIEQGPVLEAAEHPLGIVTGIVGQKRIQFVFIGMAGHAGTTPMDQRRDALVGAAAFVTAVEEYARGVLHLVATVGALRVQPNVANVIPDRVTLTVDVRHENPEILALAGERLSAMAEEKARGHRLEVGIGLLSEQAGAACDHELCAVLETAMTKNALPAHRMLSGAGHDAMVLAGSIPTAMLFLRCGGGISHHPSEAVDEADVAAAVSVLRDFVLLLAEQK